ncbi:MAG: hypothetical protein LBP26_06560 [Clostridiales bacterium]|jgi:hypothetical protein|nr:hypothetical protein [Clostridiales bacterium]
MRDFNNEGSGADNGAKRFFDWAYGGRAKTVADLDAGTDMPPEKVFLSFLTHTPAFISDGPEGLNACIKGVGFLPKEQYLAAALKDYLAHIKSYEPGDRDYGKRGLKLLIKHLYGADAKERVDFSRLGSLEMAFKHSWGNYNADSRASLLFYRPPAISYELKGVIEIRGGRHGANDKTPPESLDIYQQYVNAQHDCYHTPDISLWKTRPAYLFRIREVYDKSASKSGFGTRLEL